VFYHVAVSSLILKKHPVSRALHYLFLLPFLPALRPLLVNFHTLDAILYLSGMALVLFIIIYSNHRPLLCAENDSILLYLHYRHNAERHPYREIIGYQRISRNRIALHSRSHSPVTLALSGTDRLKLIDRLEKEGIHAVEPDK
jgi:hypothetical protein